MTTVKFRGSWYYTYQKVFNPLSTTRFWQKHLPNYLIFYFWYKISMTGVDFIFVTFSISEIDCNWTNVFFAIFKICRHIRMHGRQGVHDKKKKGNLHRNSLFLIRYIISNAIVTENYKWCFKKTFRFLLKHNYRRNAWQDTKVL